MNGKIQSAFYKLKVVCVAVICFTGIAATFICSESLSKIICSSLNLKIDPSFIGGPLIADFTDDAEDDYGCGNLLYPDNEEFPDGCLDVVHYSVHEPVCHARWQLNADYWQLDLEFRKKAGFVRNLLIYISVDDGNSSSTELSSSISTLFENAENVEFDSEHPWNFAVWIFGAEGKVYDAKGTELASAQMIFLNEGKKLNVRIPLENKKLQKIYSAKNTFHYVISGAWSRFDAGGFMPIEKFSSASRGGMNESHEFNPYVPKAYDVLGNNAKLSILNYEKKSIPEVHPVKVKMTD